ncbi:MULTISPECIES: HpcH/HpaI aldolase/citrate lyase family protein [unclassified Gordonia (in: high G+C Gram-positive bacteria)]|uniref:HpcH/HpaI aldolase/citrate lyase family protein n=1 Tax=unclassified Gordonia (in: high G+C Gram-positive bacteria) TaxID=2657482 RepID=UPI001F053650|nr:HpcH/HpaI aldolase/citrate lyase family protein [Gordonia sp. PDNC005]
MPTDITSDSVDPATTRGITRPATTRGITQFPQLADEQLDRLFLHRPQTVDLHSPIDHLAIALGATLYVPATRDDLTAVIRRRAESGVTSMVIDLEDAVADEDEATAVDRTITTLAEFADDDWDRLLLFVRVRTTAHIETVIAGLTPGHCLAGFVIPKFEAESGSAALDTIAAVSADWDRPLYVMPVLETPRIVHRETRDAELTAIREVLNRHRERVLAVRIGATDICGLFGIRRDRDVTIYDVRVAADAVAGIVNMLGRRDGTGFVITGPVWEYFANHERMFAPTLRHTPFREHDAVYFRQQLVSRDLDGLLREIALDRANGITGKTVIHPVHVGAVHSLSTVTDEEYSDALDILDRDGGGAQASAYGNKMNELKPHRNWALGVMNRAHVFGVTRRDISFVDLLTEWAADQ